MGQYTVWELIVIAVLLAVVLFAGKTPSFLRKRRGAEPLPEPGRDAGQPS
jgi:Sec-independent protein translocase protein TatA